MTAFLMTVHLLVWCLFLGCIIGTTCAQNASFGAVLCVDLPPEAGGQISQITCDPEVNNNGGTALGLGTSAGSISFAAGISASALGNVAAAFGFNTSAAANSSFATGVNSRCVSDPNVPGGSSGGGAVAMGIDTLAWGDWSTSLGSGSEASGYASAAIGEGALARTWGEVALGLFPEEPGLTVEQQRNHSVIPQFNANDVVLRVGIGCKKKNAVGGIGCEEEKRLDGLRLYKSGKLFLQKLDGSKVEDVAEELDSCKSEIVSLKDDIAAIRQELEDLKASVSVAVSHHVSSVLSLLVLSASLISLI